MVPASRWFLSPCNALPCNIWVGYWTVVNYPTICCSAPIFIARILPTFHLLTLYTSRIKPPNHWWRVAVDAFFAPQLLLPFGWTTPLDDVVPFLPPTLTKSVATLAAGVPLPLPPSVALFILFSVCVNRSFDIGHGLAQHLYVSLAWWYARAMYGCAARCCKLLLFMVGAFCGLSPFAFPPSFNTAAGACLAHRVTM